MKGHLIHKLNFNYIALNIGTHSPCTLERRTRITYTPLFSENLVKILTAISPRLHWHFFKLINQQFLVSAISTKVGWRLRVSFPIVTLLLPICHRRVRLLEYLQGDRIKLKLRLHFCSYFIPEPH